MVLEGSQLFDPRKPDDERLKAFRDSLTAEVEQLEDRRRKAERQAQELKLKLADPPWAKAPEHVRNKRVEQHQGWLREAQAELDVQALPVNRNLRYLACLTQMLYHVRNFSSHFNALEGSSLEMPLNRRHARFLLDTCARFFQCLADLARDRPLLAGCCGTEEENIQRMAQLRGWAERCDLLLREQAEDDARFPIHDDVLLYDAGLGAKIWELAGPYMTALAAASRLEPGDYPLSHHSEAGFRWLRDMQRLLEVATKARRSFTFSDPAWGLAIANELLLGCTGALPAWPGDWQTYLDDGDGGDGQRQPAGSGRSCRYREVELRARMAALLGGVKCQSPAYVELRLSALGSTITHQAAA